jgi:spore germination protein GerM
MTRPRTEDQYSEQETQQRFENLVKSALNTPPKTLKSMTPKGVPAQSKKRKIAPIGGKT